MARTPPSAFKAIADPTRREILRLLRDRELSAGDIAARQITPYARECLRLHGIATRGLRSKPWGEFFGLTNHP